LVYEHRNIYSTVILTVFLIGLARTLDIALPPVYSDTMTGGALSQRIGSFDVELKTIPSMPVAGDKTDIFIRIGTIDRNDAIDTPITIRIAKQGEEVYRSNTIFVPNGHYSYPYIFAKSGIYGVYILIHDSSAIGETKTSSHNTSSQGQGILFTFPVNVQSSPLLEFSWIQLISTLAGVAAVCAVIVFYYRIRKNRGKRSFRPAKLT
jgi:hypothetical protein